MPMVSQGSAEPMTRFVGGDQPHVVQSPVRTVLLVEDDPALLNVLTRFLQIAGIRVLPAEDAQAAELREVVDGVFAWVQPDGTWWINNAGAVTGGDGTLVVDTCATERRTALFLDTLVLATDGAPITRAANTHHHGDHTHGNYLFSTATVVAHERTREEEARRRVTEERLRIARDLHDQLGQQLTALRLILERARDAGTPAAADLAKQVAEAAEAANHHPDLAIRYPGRLEVVLTTHSAGGLTALDVELARQVDALASAADATPR